MRRGLPVALLLGMTLLSAGLPHALSGQESLPVRRSSGEAASPVAMTSQAGFLAFSASALRELGWEMDDAGAGFLLRFRETGLAVGVNPGSPFLRWGEREEGVHLAEPPYLSGGRLFLPAQFLVDILPWKLPGYFRSPRGGWSLEVVDGVPPTNGDPSRVVVIDAGHGGRDPGTLGRSGTREKDIVLGISRALARILEKEEKLEVRLTRDSDVLIPIWQRGELATRWKGDRHGVFISIHANALPNSRATRGFETYFLSEARTEHERRVAALENAAMELEGEEDRPRAGDPDLSFILTELRNLDHAHWSALLAEIVQEELEPVHPGPNRGVKQAPLAVITNSLMPAVLVEVGFLSNPQEERLLRQEAFQEDVAEAVARAVLEFFRRYPPGGEWADLDGARR